MAFIEGVGDEVVQFFICFLLFIVGLFAWWSTRITERPLVRTVLILERRGNRQVAGDTPTTVQPAQSSEEKPADSTSVEQPEENNETPVPSCELTEEESVQSRRLAYYEEGAAYTSIVGDGSQQSSVNSSNGTNLPESDKDVSAVDESDSNSKECDKLPEEPHNIRIRLKYLNDDLKMVDGNLEEQLGDFKRRHFSLELSGRKLVRLIFNGQVLGQDTWTLGHYGLFDNCVVHCLVHNPRTPPPSPNLNARESSSSHRQLSAWAVSNVLLAGFSIILGLAWYGRYHYAHLYTATTTVALVGLTGLFTVSLVGIYMPEFIPN